MSADQTIPLPNVTRIEVIDSTGRAFTQYYEIAGCTVQTQDEGRTLKVFANVPEGDMDPRSQPIRCLCDGGAFAPYQRHPFIVNPECLIHGRPANRDGAKS